MIPDDPASGRLKIGPLLSEVDPGEPYPGLRRDQHVDCDDVVTSLQSLPLIFPRDERISQSVCSPDTGWKGTKLVRCHWDHLFLGELQAAKRSPSDRRLVFWQ